MRLIAALMIFGAMALSQSLCAAEIKWSGVSGFWKTDGNWIGGIEPVANDTVIFPDGGYTVDIDKSTDGMGMVVVESGLSDRPLVFRDAEGMRRLSISNGEKAYTTGFITGSGRHVVVDGIELSVGKNRDLEIGPNSVFSVDRGKVILNYGNIIVNTNAVLNVNGGTVEWNNTGLYLKLAKNAVVNFNGGSNVIGQIINTVGDRSEFDGEGSQIHFSGGINIFPNQYSFGSQVDKDKTKFEFTGGILDVCDKRMVREIRSLMPPKGGELRSVCNGEALTDKEGVGDVWKFGGRAIFSAENSYGQFGWGTDTKVEGGGDLFINSIQCGSNVSHVDLTSVNISSKFIANSANGRLNFVDGIKFGAYGDVGVEPKKSAVFVLHGRLQFDTIDVFDRETPRSFDLHSRFVLSDITSFEVEGNGSVNATSKGAMGYLRRFYVDEGAVVSLTNSDATVKASVFSLGAGARFNAGANAVDVLESVEIGDGAKIRFTFESLQDGEMYPLWFGPYGTVPPVSDFEFEPALPEGWFVAVNGSTAYLSDGTVHEVDTLDKRSYWIGSEGGNWNVADNWTTNGTAQNIPGGSSSLGAIFSGDRQLAVTNDWSKDFAWMRNMEAAESAGPYIISGKPLAMSYPQDWTTSSSSVGNSSRFPFLVESKMFRYWWDPDHTEIAFFNVQAKSAAPVIMTGGGSLTNAVFQFYGDVRIGGEWETLGLFPASASSSSRATRLALLPGASLLVTEQGSNQTVKASYQISAGSSMTLGGDIWRWTTSENTHFVEGVVTSVCPVQATARQTFIGNGSMSLSVVQSDAEGSGELKFAEDITVRPAAWKTVRAGADSPMTMIVRDNATVGASCDWTYGAEEGFESSIEASARALKVIGGAKTRVFFDTEGHSVTLKDPLVVEKWSTVVKKGEGTLVLKSSENVLSDSEFELEGGELKIDAAQAFGKLVFNGGAITVGTELDADSYVEVLTAKEIVGEVAVSGRFRVKTAANDSGVSVLVRRERGTAVIVR